MCVDTFHGLLIKTTFKITALIPNKNIFWYIINVFNMIIFFQVNVCLLNKKYEFLNNL